jgi:hypothetical protein
MSCAISYHNSVLAHADMLKYLIAFWLAAEEASSKNIITYRKLIANMRLITILMRLTIFWESRG